MMQSGSDPESPPRAVLLLIASVVPLKRPALATYGCNTFSKRRCAQYRSWLYCHDVDSTPFLVLCGLYRLVADRLFDFEGKYMDIIGQNGVNEDTYLEPNTDIDAVFLMLRREIGDTARQTDIATTPPENNAVMASPNEILDDFLRGS
jgi:hypothetical protein